MTKRQVQIFEERLKREMQATYHQGFNEGYEQAMIDRIGTLMYAELDLNRLRAS